ncbi:MAG: histidine kinase [bacterium]|nr:histidine kinase [bacterium]
MTDPIDDRQLEALAVLDALHHIAWGRQPNGELRPLAPLPDWLTRQFPGLARADADVELELPFLEAFLVDAERFWQQRSGTVLRSDPWTQLGETGDPCVFEATAVVTSNGDEVLLVSLLGAEFAARRQALQDAREQRLAYEDLCRAHDDLVQATTRVERLAEQRHAAIEMLRRSREDLENGAAEQTVALRDLADRLQREVDDHARTNAELVEHQERLRAMAERILVTEAEERRRVAEFVHDRIGQNLAAIKLKLGVAKQSADDAGRERLAAIGQLIDEVVKDTRSVTAELGTPALYELGLVEALRDHVERFEVAHGVTATFEDDGADKPLSESAELFVFQAVNELLHNVLKHSDAAEVRVHARREGRIVSISVADAGVGFEARGADFRVSSTGGFGLFNIRERALHFGGDCRVLSTPGRGTEVTLNLPLALTD